MSATSPAESVAAMTRTDTGIAAPLPTSPTAGVPVALAVLVAAFVFWGARVTVVALCRLPLAAAPGTNTAGGSVGMLTVLTVPTVLLLLLLLLLRVWVVLPILAVVSVGAVVAGRSLSVAVVVAVVCEAAGSVKACAAVETLGCFWSLLVESATVV